jgi:hypothetical protein
VSARRIFLHIKLSVRCRAALIDDERQPIGHGGGFPDMEMVDVRETKCLFDFDIVHRGLVSKRVLPD